MMDGSRWLIVLGGRIVPKRRRAEWRARWEGELREWAVLTDRGEVRLRDSAELGRDCWGAVAEAVWLRFSKEEVRRWVRGPVFLLAASAALLALGAALTNGFAATRSLVELARSLEAHPVARMGYDPRSDRLFAAIAPLVFAMATGIALVAVAGLPWRGHGWRYGALLGMKMVLVMAAGPLVWIDGGTALRSHISHEGLRVLGGGLGFAVVFVASFSYAMWWVMDDQRKRCPECLHRLALPVRMGSWASVFEPPSTELLCDEGHGSLSVPERTDGEAERWVRLDASWRELFEKQPR